MNWISVKDKLPQDAPVLIWYKGFIEGDAAVASYSDGAWTLFHTSTNDESIPVPTHWMELPEPPNN
jgi:hypothetical protein